MTYSTAIIETINLESCSHPKHQNTIMKNDNFKRQNCGDYPVPINQNKYFKLHSLKRLDTIGIKSKSM